MNAGDDLNGEYSVIATFKGGAPAQKDYTISISIPSDDSHVQILLNKGTDQYAATSGTATVSLSNGSTKLSFSNLTFVKSSKTNITASGCIICM
jgi:hypothetical protein